MQVHSSSLQQMYSQHKLQMTNRKQNWLLYADACICMTSFAGACGTVMVHDVQLDTA